MSLLVLALALFGGDPPQDVRREPAGITAAALAPAREELRARDGRITFSRSSAERARADLERPVGEPRALHAITALGAVRDVADLERLEGLARSRTFRARRAAMFALGEFGSPGAAALERCSAEGVPGLGEVLAFSLALARGAPGPAASGLEDERFELRWRAAKRYGSVDGIRYSELALERLGKDRSWLDRLVVGAAGRLESGRVRAHLLELLRERPSLALLRAAAGSVPRALDELFVAEEWTPSDPGEWAAIVSEIDARRRGAEAKTLLQGAFAFEETVRFPAGIALLRAGSVPSVDWAEGVAETTDRSARLALFETAGDQARTWLIPILEATIEAGADLETVAVATLAMARMGFAPAVERLTSILERGASPERAAFLWALSRGDHDRDGLDWVERALDLPDLDPLERSRLEFADARCGGTRDHARLRDFLVEGIEVDPSRVAVVRALALDPGPGTGAFLAEFFPDGEDPDLDLELALALLERREARALRLLRAALWNGDGGTGDRGQSCLAGGVLIELLGRQALLSELDSPPARARPEDLRRVGFALGEFAGLAAVQELARGRSASDPALQGAELGALSARGL